MKELLTTHDADGNKLTGGNPIKMEDLKYLQEAMSQIVKGFGGFLPDNKVFVLNGVEITYNTSELNVDVPGYVYYNGEIFYVPTSQSDALSGQTAQWEIIEDYDSRGTKVFKEDSESGTETNVFLHRKMELKYMDDGTGEIAYDGNTLNYERYLNKRNLLKITSGDKNYYLDSDTNLVIVEGLDNGCNIVLFTPDDMTVGRQVKVMYKSNPTSDNSSVLDHNDNLLDINYGTDNRTAIFDNDGVDWYRSGFYDNSN